MGHIAAMKGFADLWTLAMEVWNHDFMGIAAGRIILALFILGIAAVVRRLFGIAVLRHIRFRFRHSNGAIDNKAAVEALAPPIRFIPIVLAIFIISQFITANPSTKEIFGEINRSLIAFTVFWVLFELTEPLLLTFYGRAELFSHAMIDWSVRVGRIVLIAVGFAVILEIWGINVGPILAGLGLFGVAVGLGAQDLFKNLIAGMFIIGEKRFKNGDWIQADNVVDGIVENIGLRATKVRRWDMAPAYVPNSKLSDNAVTNFGQMTYRRISWVIGLEYRTTVDQLREIRDNIEAYILGNADFARPPDAPWTFVRVDSFGDSSINLMVYCFSRTTEWGGWLKVKEGLIYAIKKIVEQAGSDFAFPSRSLYVETLPAGTEAFPLHRHTPGP
jgi:MscS family membrane protein